MTLHEQITVLLVLLTMAFGLGRYDFRYELEEEMAAIAAILFIIGVISAVVAITLRFNS